MAWEDDIVSHLRQVGRPLDDDELAKALGVSRRQTVNIVCRKLVSEGRLIRELGPRNKIVNRLPGMASEAPPVPPPLPAGTSALLSEDEVKRAVADHLESRGYTVKVAWAKQRGIDIDAQGPDGRIVIEAKAEVLLQPQQVNYFLGALGELVQRMDDPDATYGLALPDNKQYRGLVDRLPALARERLGGLVVYFVSRDGDRLVVRGDR